jgi:hypothetical protein
MAFVSFDDFRDDNDDIDWDAYHKEQERVGEICYQCGASMLTATMIGSLFGREDHVKTKQLCYACKNLDADKSERVEHQQYLRCPKCGHRMTVSGAECCDWFEIYEEGEHGVCCTECDHEFEISTRVEFHFTSPAMEASND